MQPGKGGTDNVWATFSRPLLHCWWAVRILKTAAHSPGSCRRGMLFHSNHSATIWPRPPTCRAWTRGRQLYRSLPLSSIAPSPKGFVHKIRDETRHYYNIFRSWIILPRRGYGTLPWWRGLRESRTTATIPKTFNDIGKAQSETPDEDHVQPNPSNSHWASAEGMAHPSYHESHRKTNTGRSCWVSGFKSRPNRIAYG